MVGEETPIAEQKMGLERLVFFSDAVVAIAITLLALDLKIERTSSGHLHFSDLIDHWRTFAAFVLSFINIANFWKNHHMFFCYIDRLDNKLLWICIGWLFFIAMLPFTTSLVSTYFSDTAAMFSYSLNTLLIVMFQNWLWDYASIDSKLLRPDSIKPDLVSRLQVFCNLDMVNAGLGVVLSFVSPTIAFITLFTKLPIIIITTLYYRPFGRTYRKRFK